MGRTRSADRRVRTRKAQPGYFWAYEEDGIPPVGTYYAKVRPTEDCKGDRSTKLGIAS